MKRPRKLVIRMQRECPLLATLVLFHQLFHPNGAVDLTERASYLENVSLGRAKPSDKKQADAVATRWKRVCKAAQRRSAPGGDGWRYEHFDLWLKHGGSLVPPPPPQHYPAHAAKALADALRLPPGLAVPLRLQPAQSQHPRTRSQWTYANAVDTWARERALSWPQRACAQPRSARGARGRRRR